MILLLDIDGVLNSECYRNNWIKEHPYGKYQYLLDPEALSLYKLIINKYNPKVFLVSSWRLDLRAQKVLKKHGIYFEDYVNIPNNRLEFAVNLACSNPTQTIILLDDDTKKLPKIHRLFLVHTSWKKGLKAKHIKKINKIMQKGF